MATTIGSKLVNGPLKSKLVELIRMRGPVTVSEYMRIVLTNPESGFYMNEDVFGVKGHFTTSPEISQVFGEVLGAWIMQEWTRFKCPKPLRLVEFGPGRGTLMADITRTLKSLGQDKPQVNFIELSPHLQKVQEKTIDKQLDTRWFTSIEGLRDDQDGFTAYIAHEFLDALPVHKFVRDPKTNRWRELLVDYDEKENLRYCIARQPSLSVKLLVPENFSGDHLEVCPQAALEMEKVSKRLNQTRSGCALVCDYGFEDEPEPAPGISGSTKVSVPKSDRDTLRAFKNHEPWPPLREPGEADLTADVDFGYLKRHLKDKSTIFGPVCQKDFLLKCGLQARLDTLMQRKKDEKDREDLSSGASMLIDSMGDRYKFMAMFPKDSGDLFKDDPPAGFG